MSVPTRTHNRHVALGVSMLLLAVVGCSEVDGTGAEAPLLRAERIDVRGGGTVSERLTTGRYTYFRLDPSTPEVWYVAAGDVPRLGGHVAFRGYAQLQDYRSPTLARRFDTLIFASTQTPDPTQEDGQIP